MLFSSLFPYLDVAWWWWWQPGLHLHLPSTGLQSAPAVKVGVKAGVQLFFLFFFRWSIVNITVVTITVVDTVRSEFTRGTRAATILPCNSSLTFTNAASLFAKNIYLESKCYRSILQGNDTPLTHGSSRPRSWKRILTSQIIIIGSTSLNVQT